MNLYQPTITGSLSVSGSVNISGSITIAGGGTISGTASIATTALTASSADNLLVRNTLTAQTLVVQTITSSVDFVTGSTRFGSILGNTHQFTGSVSMTGSLAVVTTGTELQVNASGVNIGNALTDSHIISGSVRINPNGLFVSSSGLSIFGGTSTTSANPTVVMQNRLGTVLSVAGFNWAGTTTDNNSVNSLMILGGYLNTSAQTVATATTAAGMQFYDGGFYWYGNTGLTPGSVYTNTQRMFLTSGGNLIIGSGGDGGFRLDVSGTARITGAATFLSTITASDTVSINTDVTMLRFGNLTRWGFQRPASDNRYISFMRNMNATATPVWTVDGDNGLVGIGTTSPSSAGGGYGGLDIRGSGGGSLVLGVTSAIYTYLYAESSGLYIQTTSTLPILFIPGGTERMRIQSDGSILAGTTNDGFFNGSVQGTGLFGSNGFIAASRNGGSTAFFNRYTSTGDVVNFRYAGSNVGSISTNGSTVTFSGNALSDERFKENIQPITNALDAINAVEFVTFKFKENNKDSAGVTAQNLQTIEKLSPFVIDGATEEDYKAVDYNAIVGYLGKAIQELKAEFNEYKATHP